MNAKTFLLSALTALSALGVQVAHAGEATYDYPTRLSSQVSRAEVLDGAVQARVQGLIANGEQGLVPTTPASTLTRIQVKAETLEAIRVGAVVAGEAADQPTAIQLERIRSAGQRALRIPMAAL